MLTATRITVADAVRPRRSSYNRRNGEATTARCVSSRMQAAAVVRSEPVKPALLLKQLFRALLSAALCKESSAFAACGGPQGGPGDLLSPPTPAWRAPDPALLLYCTASCTAGGFVTAGASAAVVTRDGCCSICGAARFIGRPLVQSKALLGWQCM